MPFRFAGGLHDDLTGLVRFGARDYDPELGRWTAKDPIGFAAGDPNLYAYVSGDPINGIDPTGLIIDTLGDVAAVGGCLFAVLRDNIMNNCGNFARNAKMCAIAAVAAIIPFVSVGMLRRAYRGRRLHSPGELMGVERASPELLEAVARRRTVVIASPGSEELRYLDFVGAEANVGGADLTHIVLREDPSKAAVLEEFLHGTQQRLGIIERLGRDGAEWQVKDFMIRHQRLLGLSDADVAILRQLRDMGL